VLDGGYHGITARQRVALRELLSVNGRSYSELIYDKRGNPDWDASRRVVFKFRLTDEQMIEQLKDILEQNDEQLTPVTD
jgi:chemotaxis protein MotB